jgi:hypothetical protein
MKREPMKKFLRKDKRTGRGRSRKVAKDKHGRLKILSSQKRGGFRGLPFEPFLLPTPSLMFFLTLEGLIFLFKFQKTVFSV